MNGNPFASMIPNAGANPFASMIPAPKGALDTIPAPNLGQRTGAEQVAGIQKIGSSIATGARSMQQGFAKGGIGGVGDFVKGAAQAGFGTITGVARTAFAPVTAVLSPLISKQLSYEAQQHPKAAEFISGIAGKVNDLAAKHPESASLIGDIVNTALLAIGGGAAEAPVKEAITTASAKAAAKDIVGGVTSIPGKISEAAVTAKGVKAVAEDVAKTSKIAEKIAPKSTPKEIKAAQAQGRLTAAKPGGLIRSGKPGYILPSKSTVQAAKTIARYIPDAEKLDPNTLYGKLDNTINGIAKRLSPVMKRTLIKPETISKINEDWKVLKGKQMEKVSADLEKNLGKRQSTFENFLKKSGSKNLNDLWGARKSYDSSISSNVKNATDQSAPDIWQQKQEWLQNRKILNDAIYDAQKGLKTQAKQSFSDMSDMYDAQGNLQTTANIEKAAPSKIRALAEAHPYLTGSILTGAATATGIPQKVVQTVTGL